jgi:hypothetical protein
MKNARVLANWYCVNSLQLLTLAAMACCTNLRTPANRARVLIRRVLQKKKQKTSQNTSTTSTLAVESMPELQSTSPGRQQHKGAHRWTTAALSVINKIMRAHLSSLLHLYTVVLSACASHCTSTTHRKIKTQALPFSPFLFNIVILTPINVFCRRSTLKNLYGH